MYAAQVAVGLVLVRKKPKGNASQDINNRVENTGCQDSTDGLSQANNGNRADQSRLWRGSVLIVHPQSQGTRGDYAGLNNIRSQKSKLLQAPETMADKSADKTTELKKSHVAEIKLSLTPAIMGFCLFLPLKCKHPRSGAHLQVFPQPPSRGWLAG
ncbi:hypothetical protein RRG08_061346 [Elysia crispata]|uniref:Uncharacterized protein n=1 Tax=Elysia crispata TaxID=231223 RepID=A0AAE1DYB0_9GAST|nr:hypothetical protein RRG08_061346 [Elysia crispata]